jgi:hypothetical protein
MDTSKFSGFVREGAEEGLDIALDGWGCCRDGAFRYESHETAFDGFVGTPLDADFEWCPDWTAVQRLIETSGIELLGAA